jgi:hypothetical protein
MKSKGRRLQRKKLASMVREKRRELQERNLSRSISRIFRRDKNDPLAPYPINAMLTTKKAKWYCWEIEKYLVRDISRQRVAEEMRNIPARERFCMTDIGITIQQDGVAHNI